ncbi:MAG: hypothetical protein M9924_14075 [Rhizobiaceae bacterium]|nr:hypothetical protein [Rhizobiaceae bacterium]
MLKIVFAALAMAMTSGAAFAASAVNLDSETRTIVVTEGGSRQQIDIAPGETVDFCANGCFVTLPNGDREALTGGETVEISGGAAKIK